MPKECKPCAVCEKPICDYPAPLRRRRCCSRKCYSKWLSKIQKGEGNNNYGRHWSQEAREEQSKRIQKVYEESPELRYRVGSANRGVKFSPERIRKMRENRKPEIGVRTHSPEVRAKIGEKSAEKWTPEFRESFRKTMEERGHWIPKDKKNDWEIYKDESNWIQAMFDLVDHRGVLREHGIFHYRKNPSGLVRAHRFSRRSGFRSGVFPEIMHHPENCELITHADNVRKSASKTIPSDSISLEELFDLIENSKYNNWEEQEICIQRIKDYRNGKRWTREE